MSHCCTADTTSDFVTIMGLIFYLDFSSIHVNEIMIGLLVKTVSKKKQESTPFEQRVSTSDYTTSIIVTIM